MTWLAILAAALLLSGAVVAHAVIVAPTVDDHESDVDRVARAVALTFDEHAAAAAALLQPDPHAPKES